MLEKERHDTHDPMRNEDKLSRPIDGKIVFGNHVKGSFSLAFCSLFTFEHHLDDSQFLQEAVIRTGTPHWDSDFQCVITNCLLDHLLSPNHFGFHTYRRQAEKSMQISEGGGPRDQQNLAKHFLRGHEGRPELCVCLCT